MATTRRPPTLFESIIYTIQIISSEVDEYNELQYQLHTLLGVDVANQVLVDAVERLKRSGIIYCDDAGFWRINQDMIPWWYREAM